MKILENPVYLIDIERSSRFIILHKTFEVLIDIIFEPKLRSTIAGSDRKVTNSY